jgi:cytochrome P450
MTRRRDLAHLPGSFGMPVIGYTLRFARDAERWASSALRDHGRIYKSHFMFEPIVVFADPDAARQVLMDRSETFSSTYGWEPTIGKLFARGLMLRDFDDHRHHRRIMQAAFRSDVMAGYLDLMQPIIAHALDGWRDRHRVDFYAEVKQITLNIASTAFVGLPLGDGAAWMNRRFMDAVNASVAPVRWELPGSTFRKGMEARRQLERFFGDLIPDRRTSGGDDMLTRLCHAESEDGERFADDEIVDHMIFLLLAAHDTTTSTLATMAWEMATRPDLQDEVRAEVAALPGGRFSWDRRDALPLTDRVFREAMRLHPPVPFIPRRLMKDADVAGVWVPKGTMISVATLLIHRLPELWSDPLAFDPERYAPDREEHKGHSHGYIPFGGGVHTCIGMHFAGHMAKAIMTDLLLRHRLVSLPGQRVEIQTVPIPKPRGGLPLLLEPIR